MAETQLNLKQTGLTSGSSMSITPMYSGSGIDEHTKALWHFDGSAMDAIDNNRIQDIYDFSDEQFTYKFGKSAQLFPTSDGVNYMLNWPLSIGRTFTLDAWIYLSVNGGLVLFGDTNRDNYLKIDAGGFYVCINGNETQISSTFSSENIHHIAFVSNEGYFKAFYDGQNKTYGDGYDLSSSFNGFNFEMLRAKCTYADKVSYVDELRLSDNVRWDSDFTTPSEPYSKREFLGNAINFDPTSISGYSSSGTKTLKIVDGVLTWVS